MIRVRRSDERGQADYGWLKTFHTFSFGSYQDPLHTHYRALRVINEDWIQGGTGFGTHPHDNMEIITYIIEGALEHRDSMGNGSVIKRGELQRMSAGTGITHSEFNPLDADTHLLQLWIHPAQRELEPGYEQRDFSDLLIPDRWNLLASPSGRENSLTIHQDVELYECSLSADNTAVYHAGPERHAWIQLIHGHVDLNGYSMQNGDGAAVEQEDSIEIKASADSELLLFDLA